VVSKLIWHKDFSLEVFVFARCLPENMLPKKDNLGRCGVLIDEGSQCVYGCSGVESVHHLFLNCNIFLLFMILGL